jgi:hypothetical protein
MQTKAQHKKHFVVKCNGSVNGGDLAFAPFL